MERTAKLVIKPEEEEVKVCKAIEDYKMEAVEKATKEVTESTRLSDLRNLMKNMRGCKIFCVYGNETFQIRIRYVVVFVGFCSRVFCRIYLSGYSISCPLSFMHAF